MLHGAVAHAADPGGANAPSNATALPAAPTTMHRTAVVRRGAWFVATSANFQICSLESADVASTTAEACEDLRTALAAKCGFEPTAWRPRCHVVLHVSSASYEATVGAGGRVSLASALVRHAGNGIALRQIDVRGDVADFLATALPHELCHVLLADRLPEPPLWCDEGLALQFDSLAKQRLHDRDLRRSLASGETLPLEALLKLRQYPAAADWPAFYGQSASVVRCLLQHGDAQQLIEFAELQAKRDVNSALREIYGLRGCDHLDQLWRESLGADHALTHSLTPHSTLVSQRVPVRPLVCIDLATTDSLSSSVPFAPE